MWYMPYLRVRHAVLVYACIVAGLGLAAIALRLWPGAVPVADHLEALTISVSDFLAGATALVGGFATVLGLNLAAENDGHLEVAWTKPVSRHGYALGVFAVDIGAMAACTVFTAVCAAIVVDVYAAHQAVTLGSGGAFVRTLAYFGFPLCIYAWIAAASASLKRNRGIVAGLFWPAVIALGVASLLPVPAVHAVAEALNLFNPVALYSTNSGPHRAIGFDTGNSVLWGYLWGWAVSAFLLAVAVLQWRRLQL